MNATQPTLSLGLGRPRYNFRERFADMADGESFTVDTDRERVAAIMAATRSNVAIQTQKVHGVGFKVTRIRPGYPLDYFDNIDEESR